MPSGGPISESFSVLRLLSLEASVFPYVQWEYFLPPGVGLRINQEMDGKALRKLENLYAAVLGRQDSMVRPVPRLSFVRQHLLTAYKSEPLLWAGHVLSTSHISTLLILSTEALHNQASSFHVLNYSRCSRRS